MKKTRYITALFLCCIILLFTGCSQRDEPEIEIKLPEPSFQTGEPHSNPLTFRLWFETMTSTYGPCTVSIQDKIYSEEQSSEWWYAIQTDLSVLNRALDLTEDAYTPFTIYIVEETLNGIQVSGNRLYCTPEDVLSGDYRQGLIGAALTSEPWKQAGLLRSLFDGERTDRKQITAYLKNVDHLDILSLFAAYFVDDFATEEEISIALGLSQLLCEHVMDAHGGAMLIKDDCKGCRQELLDELGVKGTYTDPYGNFDSGFLYASSEDHPLTVTTPRGDSFHLMSLRGDMETPAEVRGFLYDMCTLPQRIIESLKPESPKFAELLAENYSAPLSIYLESGLQLLMSQTDVSNRKIHTGYTYTAASYMIYFLIPPTTYTEIWRYYACQVYLLYRYYPASVQRIYDTFFSDPDTVDGSGSGAGFLDIALKAREIYLSHAPFPQTADEVDQSLWNQAWVASCHLSAPGTYEQKSIAQQYGGMAKAVNGNELTLDEICAFVPYLIENYSLSNFLDYCADVDATFEEIYGIDYETVKMAWLEDLTRL